MNKQKIIKVERSPMTRKSVLINIRISPNIRKWLASKRYSPTSIFYEALRDLDCVDAGEPKDTSLNKGEKQ